MPQLGPLNWLVLYLYFWFICTLLLVIMWWESDYSTDIPVGSTNHVHNWKWY